MSADLHADTRLQPAARGTRKSPMSRLAAGKPHDATLYTLGRIERIEAVRSGVPARVLATLADDMQMTRDQLFLWAGGKPPGDFTDTADGRDLVASLVLQMQSGATPEGRPDAQPAGKVSLDWGTAWAGSTASLPARVPSVIVGEEFNVLIDQRHPDAAGVTARKVRRWLYDGRFAG